MTQITQLFNPLIYRPLFVRLVGLPVAVLLGAVFFGAAMIGPAQASSLSVTVENLDGSAIGKVVERQLLLFHRRQPREINAIARLSEKFWQRTSTAKRALGQTIGIVMAVAGRHSHDDAPMHWRLAKAEKTAKTATLSAQVMSRKIEGMRSLTFSLVFESGEWRLAGVSIVR